jgi:hypothetical protein
MSKIKKTNPAIKGFKNPVTTKEATKKLNIVAIITTHISIKNLLIIIINSII